MILGSFFDETVDGQAYLQMLNGFAFPQLAINFNNRLFRGLWWAQNSALAHRLVAVKDRFKVFEKNRDSFDP